VAACAAAGGIDSAVHGASSHVRPAPEALVRGVAVPVNLLCSDHAGRLLGDFCAESVPPRATSQQRPGKTLAAGLCARSHAPRGRRSRAGFLASPQLFAQFWSPWGPLGLRQGCAGGRGDLLGNPGVTLGQGHLQQLPKMARLRISVAHGCGSVKILGTPKA